MKSSSPPAASADELSPEFSTTGTDVEDDVRSEEAAAAPVIRGREGDPTQIRPHSFPWEHSPAGM